MSTAFDYPKGYHRPWHETPTLHLRIQRTIEALADAQWEGDDEKAELLATELTMLIDKEKAGETYDPPF